MLQPSRRHADGARTWTAVGAFLGAVLPLAVPVVSVFRGLWARTIDGDPPGPAILRDVPLTLRASGGSAHARSERAEGDVTSALVQESELSALEAERNELAAQHLHLRSRRSAPGIDDGRDPCSATTSGTST